MPVSRTNIFSMDVPLLEAYFALFLLLLSYRIQSSYRCCDNIAPQPQIHFLSITKVFEY
jgi:hypothetical protein